MAVSKKELHEALTKKAKNGRLPCKALLKVSMDLNVTPKQVGTACNDLKIKISNCQLGCFG